MKPTVKDVCSAMDAWAPPGYAYAWDRSGLSTGDPQAVVRGVLVCLTVTQEAVEAAIRAKANLIVSHHPLIWDPIRSLRQDNPDNALLLKILHSNLATYSAHTNLDVARGGVNHILAETLGIENIQPLFSVPHAKVLKLITFVPASHLADLRNALAGAGAGVIGAYTECSFASQGTGTFKPGAGANPFSGEKGCLCEEAELRLEMLLPEARLTSAITALRAAHPYEEPAYDLVPLANSDAAVSLGLRGRFAKSMRLAECAEHTRQCLGASHVRAVGKASRRVREVAVLGGSGGGEVASIPPEVEVYITGDVKYHDALTASARGLALIDAGHAATEKIAVPHIVRYLRTRFKGTTLKGYVEPELFSCYEGTSEGKPGRKCR